MWETAVTIRKCSKCLDGVRKQGIPLCEECVGHGTLTKDDEATATEKGA